MVCSVQIVRWLRRAARAMEENRDFLTRLDAALGDADHGINMDRGFRKVADMLGEVRPGDTGAILKQAGMTLISSVGGASGPLYGTFFVRAGLAVQGRDELGPGDLVDLFRAGTQGVMERGRAQPGEKTMVDALRPALLALERALRENLDLEQTLRRAVQGAREGVEETIPMQARKGRASYLGERSIGHQDPGATSSYLIIKAFHDAVAAPKNEGS